MSTAAAKLFDPDAELEFRGSPVRRLDHEGRVEWLPEGIEVQRIDNLLGYVLDYPTLAYGD